MSKYNYFSMHDIKDLANIYNDYEWDSAIIEVLDPATQTNYNISFAGHSKGNKEKGILSKINFIISKK